MADLTTQLLHGTHRLPLGVHGSRHYASKRLDAELRFDADGAWSVMFVVKRWVNGMSAAPFVTEHTGIATALREYNR